MADAKELRTGSIERLVPETQPNRTGGTVLTEPEWQHRHREALRAATADNTRRTYRSAVRHFQSWGGVLPCDSTLVIRYLLAFAETLNPRTLALRLTALAQWHRAQGFPDPTASLDVRKTLAGLERLHGTPKRKAKALAIEDVERMVQALRAHGDLLARRDTALIQLAFFGAFRRSELVQLSVANLHWEKEGLVIVLSRSKTDQTGQGIHKAIPYGDPARCCPPTALRTWLDTAAITAGPVFRAINRWGSVGNDHLHPSAVTTVLTSRAEQAGLVYAHELSSHSFRRGLATSAHRAGADFLDIKRQGGWRHDGTVQGYIEEAEQFASNAAGKLLSRTRAD